VSAECESVCVGAGDGLRGIKKPLERDSGVRFGKIQIKKVLPKYSGRPFRVCVIYIVLAYFGGDQVTEYEKAFA